MISIPNEELVNFSDPSCKKALMKKYGSSQIILNGENENGEKILIFISSDSIVVRTFQSNGWLRVNYYDKNGEPAGETFEGR